MSWTRWALITVLACVAIAIAYLPPQPGVLSEQPDYVWGERSRSGIVRRAYNRAEEMLADSRLGDSLRAATVRPATSGAPGLEPEVIFPTRLPAESERQLRAAVEQWRGDHAFSDTKLLVVVRPRQRRWQQPIYVLPSSVERTCVAVVTLDYQVSWLEHNPSPVPDTSVDHWLRQSVGPCLFYATFGEPGPRIQAWLKERYFRVANFANWNSPPRVFEIRDNPGSFEMLTGDMSFDAIACTTGQRSRCRTAALRTQRDAMRMFASKPTYPGGVVHRAYWPRNFAMDEVYLSDLVREMGPERFARFWRSGAPVDSAFLAAFEEPIDGWTHHWAREYLPDLPPFGPAPRPVAVLFALLAAGAAITLAAAGVMRRQVS